jgi:osmotically-inducible protein OsmY
MPTQVKPRSAVDTEPAGAAEGQISNLAESRLHRTTYRGLKHVSCEFHEGLVILSGRVPTYYLKQIAQTIVGEVEGVGQVVNRLEVVYPSSSSDT